MKIHADTSQVRTVEVDLSEAPGRIARKAPKVMKRGALETKRNLKVMATGHGHLEQLPRFVEFEQIDALGLDYEIGFNKGGQGSLANIAVYGSENNAPIMGTPTDALRMELPAILRNLGNEGADAVFGTRR